MPVRETAVHIPRHRIQPTTESLVMSAEKSQSDKFEEAARDIESDEDEARWDERLRKNAEHKPSPEKSA